MTIWIIRRRRWEAKAAIYFLGTILVDFLESLLREYFGAWHIWVITAAGLMEMGCSRGNLHKVYSLRTFSALKFLSDLGLWCWPEGNVGTRTALFYLRLLSVGIFQVKTRSKHSGLLVNSLKNAIYLGKQMYKWNQLGEGLVSAPLTDVPGVSFDISIALTSHFYTWTRISWQNYFPIQNHRPDKAKLFVRKGLLWNMSLLQKCQGEKFQNYHRIPFVFFFPYKNFDIIS